MKNLLPKLLVWLIAFGVTVSSLATAASYGINPSSSANTAEPITNHQFSPARISSKQLGMAGPLEVGVTNSSLTGFNVDAHYTQLVTDRFGVGAIAEGGSKLLRGNLTLGLLISRNQLLKISAERLGQDLNFSFASGNISKMVYQNAGGLTYKKNMDAGVIRALSFNGQYAKAQGYSLSPVNYSNNGVYTTNYRHLAPADTISASGSMELLITPTTHLNPSLYFDSIKYNTTLESSSQFNKGGLGAALEGIQNLPNGLQLTIKGEARSISTSVLVGVNKTFLNSAQLSVFYERYNPTTNPQVNNSINLALSIPLESEPHSYRTASLSPTTQLDLRSELTPAVYKPVVNIVAEQTNVVATPTLIVVTPANQSIAPAATLQYTATAHYVDGTTEDITSRAVWSSSSTSVATINSTGLATGVSGGSTSISASYQDRSGSTSLTVNSASSPTVSGVSPNTGAGAGGTSVTITGTNFTGTTSVHFDATSASFTVDSATQITATSPAGSGTVDITVTTPSGTSTTSSADEFT